MILADYLKSKRYLPRWLRDFHDQKDVFKSIHRHTSGDDDGSFGCGWVQAQCYVIDRFLRYMAAHGYALQRARGLRGACDISETLKGDREAEVEVLKKAFAGGFTLTADAKEKP